MKYTILRFFEQFPTDDACLEHLFRLRFGKSHPCTGCKKPGNWSRVRGRKMYACSWCGKQLAPTAGTVFHKSDTSLRLWFHAVFLMSQSRNGVSAKELERQLGVTYKTAWRIGQQIRKLMTQGADLFGGTNEMDETYVGGVAKGKRGRGASKKTPVFGISNRESGQVYAKVVENVRASTLMPLVREKVAIGSRVMTDELSSYKKSASMGYNHETIQHAAKEYVRGDVTTNSIEGFWSNLKRGLDGTHHSVSPRHLQKYLDEFVFRWNHRASEEHLFDLMLKRV